MGHVLLTVEKLIVLQEVEGPIGLLEDMWCRGGDSEIVLWGGDVVLQWVNEGS